MNKADRERIFNKCGGRCAYCGEVLVKGWHVDEVYPVRRNTVWNTEKRRYELDKAKPYEHPERMTLENQLPACAKCNINKHSDSLEEFRKNIRKYLDSLNARMVQYQMAKKYNLIQETGFDVVFYFEKLGVEIKHFK